ncbi:uncharacterized protein LOC123695182 [Colias croceus]|uniref:uncharacterized protein LOC123695182 n=1 Tax=Colias crocea TaxID=72248 RepID=UPI001E27F3F0|nr:uncharacterized protein LOC123695182 [Colias croceus]
MYIQAVILLHASLILCRKRYRDSSSEESIENVLYYQDCQHKKDPPKPLQLRAVEPTTTTKKPQECKMCCTMCCGDECTQTNSGRTMSMNQPRQPFPVQQPRKIEPSRPTRPRARNAPFFARRDLGFTKDNIKSLISQDMDIRKILKDLVRVTMQKVDLMQLMNSRTEKPRDSVFENDL